MASNYFTISPTGGTDNGYVLVSATGANLTQQDKKATVTISNGSVSTAVTVTQYGLPSITRVGGAEPVEAPATGATYQFYVETHYPVQFRNKPDWITIDDSQGNYISSAVTIQPTVANGKTYNFTVAPNATNDSRSATTFGLYHYIHNELSSRKDLVTITQPQGASDFISITPTSALDWDDTNGKAITINANVSYSVSHSNTTDFTLNGGNGFVTVKANTTNTGTTLKTDTISVVSTKAGFSYTATCVVTQYRQPTIAINGSASNLPWEGSSKSVTVVSDYYWWLSPTVAPDTSAYYEYITMQGKTADMNMPPVSSTTYTLTWNQNTGATARTGYIYVGYLKLDNSTTGRSSTSVYFNQDYQASSTFEVTPDRIPANTGDYVSSGGGTYQLSVVTERPWSVISTRNYCTVSPTAGTGNATVTVVVPASTKDGYSYSIVDGLAFRTTDAGIVAEQTVYAYQYDRFTEVPYVSVSPAVFNLESGASSNNTFSVSANSNWYLYVVDTEGYPISWIDTTTTGGTSGYTTGLHFEVSANTDTTSGRTGKIQFTTGSPTTVAEITVNQAAAAPSNDYVVLLDGNGNYLNGYMAVSGGGNYSFAVSASTAWTAAVNYNDGSGWITIPNGSQSGPAGYTTGLYVTVGQNTSAARDANVVVTAGGASSYFSIHQYSGSVVITDYIIVSPTAMTVESATSMGNFFTISANTSWTASTNNDWIELGRNGMTGGTGYTQFLFFGASGNPYTTERYGAITFTGGTASATLSVTQESAADEPQPVGNLELDPPQISPASRSRQMYEVEVWNDTEENYTVDYGDDWAKFYDGPDPSTADEVSVIEWGERLTIWLEVQAGQNRNMTITFTGEDSGTQVGFYVNQP